MSDTSGTPFQQPTSAANDWTKLLFVFQQLLRGVATATIVRVDACTNAGGLAPAGTVDVTVMVNQVDGAGQPQAHETIYGLPYMRMQGGAKAVILDPVVGDLGIAVFGSRDLSAVVAAKGPANPGSDRVCDYSDGLYVGGLLNGVPTSYVLFGPSGITVVDPTAVTVQAPTVAVQATNATVTATTKATVTAPAIQLTGAVNVTGSLTVSGAAALDGGLAVAGGSGTNTVAGTLAATVDVTAGGKSLHNHVHGGVTSGGSSTDPPT